MSATYSSVDCQEVHGTRRESFSFTDQSASVQLMVSAANAISLARDLLDGVGRAYPHMDNLRVKSVQLQPQPGQYTQDGQSMTYEHFIASVEYGISGVGLGGGGESPDPEDPLDLASEDIEFTNEFITVSPDRYSWDPAMADVSLELTQDEAPGIMKRGINFNRTLFQVFSIPPKILTIGGCINNRIIKSKFLDLDFALYTLLALPPKISRSITTAGSSAWTLACSWQYNKWGWDKFFCAKTNDFRSIYTVNPGTGTPGAWTPYELDDMRPFIP